jgi:ectoine hydroxylase-related dioxygenase (phytanoyl-CoA dioxygenase family)
MREVDAPRVLAERGAEALLTELRAQAPKLGEPVQVEAEAGDVVLAHHLLAHGAAPNLSLRVRETVYFRLIDGRDHPQDPGPLMDAARFFDGVSFKG